MARPTGRLRRAIMSAGVALAVMGFAASQASAVTYESHYQVGYLAPQWAWATTSAHLAV